MDAQAQRRIDIRELGKFYDGLISEIHQENDELLAEARQEMSGQLERTVEEVKNSERRRSEEQTEQLKGQIKRQKTENVHYYYQNKFAEQKANRLAQEKLRATTEEAELRRMVAEIMQTREAAAGADAGAGSASTVE